MGEQAAAKRRLIFTIIYDAGHHAAAAAFSSGDVMENRIEQPARRQGRPGYWQYPEMSPTAYEDGHDRQYAYQPRSSVQRAAREEQLGLALGWLSIGLGVAHLFAPRAMARTTGLPYWPLLIRAVGVREIASGVGLITQPTNQVWRWSRVAGDAMDLTMLGIAAAHPAGDRQRLASTAAAVATITALDLRAGNPPRFTPSSQPLEGHRGQRVQQSITINRSPEECYRFWRDLERLPAFMQHLESVQVTDERHSHWRARGPAGTSVEWDAEITEDQPGQLLGWRSVKGSKVENAGTVRFTPAPGGKGTIVQVQLRYQPPAGLAGVMIAKLFGEEPSQQIKMDLRRFKQLIETGEIPTTHGQPSGARSLKASLFRRGVEQ
jgi:uncharacterized membrane protein